MVSLPENDLAAIVKSPSILNDRGGAVRVRVTIGPGA